MNEGNPLTAEGWVDLYYDNRKSPEAQAAFDRMSEEERSKLGCFMITDSMMGLKEIEAENKRNGKYRAQDTINRLQAEVAFLYLQCLQQSQFIITLIDLLNRHEQSFAPEELRQIHIKMVYLRRLENLNEHIDKHWTKNQENWPPFLD